MAPILLQGFQCLLALHALAPRVRRRAHHRSCLLCCVCASRKLAPSRRSPAVAPNARAASWSTDVRLDRGCAGTGGAQGVVPDTAGAVLRRALAPAPGADTTAQGLRHRTRTGFHCSRLRTERGSCGSPKLPLHVRA